MKPESRILDEAEYEAWDRFVAPSPSGSVYATAQYLDVLSRSVDCQFRVMAISANGKFVGGIALFERSTRWGCVLEPRLLLQYNGFVLGAIESKYRSQQASTTIGLTHQIAGFLEQQEYASTLIKCRWPFMDARAFLARGWQAVPTYTYLVPLSNLDSHWEFVDRNLKRLIRRCKNNGVTVTVDDDFDSFYRMHKETHVRKGAPIYMPERRFAKYFDELKRAGIARLYQARLPDGKSIAAQLVLAGDHPFCETASACADAEFHWTGANAFLRWKAFESLAADGYTHNDLTDASLNSVTRFKRQFGGDLRLCLTLVFPSARRKRWGTRLESIARPVLRGSQRLLRRSNS